MLIWRQRRHVYGRRESWYARRGGYLLEVQQTTRFAPSTWDARAIAVAREGNPHGHQPGYHETVMEQRGYVSRAEAMAAIQRWVHAHPLPERDVWTLVDQQARRAGIPGPPERTRRRTGPRTDPPSRGAA